MSVRLHLSFYRSWRHRRSRWPQGQQQKTCFWMAWCKAGGCSRDPSPPPAPRRSVRPHRCPRPRCGEGRSGETGMGTVAQTLVWDSGSPRSEDKSEPLKSRSQLFSHLLYMTAHRLTYWSGLMRFINVGVGEGFSQSHMTGRYIILPRRKRIISLIHIIFISLMI